MVVVSKGVIVIDICVVSRGRIVVLILIQSWRSPIVIEFLLILFSNFVEPVLLPLLVPLLAEIRPQVVGNLAV